VSADLPVWDALKFGYLPTDVVYGVEGDAEADPPWAEGGVAAEHELRLPVAAAALSYGTGIIEGLKAERSADGRVLLFRLADHAARFFRSAERMLLLPFPEERFVAAVKQLVRANARFIPPAGHGTFYVRPLEFAIEPMLGLRQGRRFMVTLYGCPVGDLGHGAVGALKVLDIPRSSKGGTAEAKAIVNYGGVLLHRERARREGFDDVLFTGAGAVQETTGTNVFCRLHSGELVTPRLDGRFLGGITRDSVLHLARAEGLEVDERELRVQEILDHGQELFCTGTATGVRNVARLVHKDREKTFTQGELGETLGQRLSAIRAGSVPDPFGWTDEVSL